MEPKKTLSASSIKTLETCTWLYWAQFHCKVPQRSNPGSLRGTIVHLVFELLLNPRHKKHFGDVLAADSINGSKAIRRLVVRNLVKAEILSVDNYQLCDEMILVGLKTDFFGKNGELGKPEYRFELESKEPEYKIRGYIDKLVFYKDGSLKIVDYKSSKNKFRAEELEANIQSFAYCLVGYKMLGAKDVSADFIFLRYPKSPIQTVHPTKEQLEGFEQYLAYLYDLVNNFDEAKAHSNLAADNRKNQWLCKAGATWICPYMNPFLYFAVKNADGKVIRSSLKKEELKFNTADGEKIVMMKYNGCPAFRVESKRKGL